MTRIYYNFNELFKSEVKFFESCIPTSFSRRVSKIQIKNSDSLDNYARRQLVLSPLQCKTDRYSDSKKINNMLCFVVLRYSREEVVPITKKLHLINAKSLLPLCFNLPSSYTFALNRLP